MAKKICFFFAIDCYQYCHLLSSNVIDYQRFPYFLGGQKENAFTEEIQWNKIT